MRTVPLVLSIAPVGPNTALPGSVLRSPLPLWCLGLCATIYFLRAAERNSRDRLRLPEMRGEPGGEARRVGELSRDRTTQNSNEATHDFSHPLVD